MKTHRNRNTADLAVDDFEVVIPWASLSVPIKATQHAFFTARKPTVQHLHGSAVYNALRPSALMAEDGFVSKSLEILLARGEVVMAPPAGRPVKTLRIEMERSKWETIERLAAFYGKPPLALVHAGLVARRDFLDGFDRGKRRTTAASR
jgi:hypothetical protein